MVKNMSENWYMDKKERHITHGIVHAGFSGLRRFVARKKVSCNLIVYRLVIPHDTIPSPLYAIQEKNITLIKIDKSIFQLSHI